MPTVNSSLCSNALKACLALSFNIKSMYFYPQQLCFSIFPIKCLIVLLSFYIFQNFLQWNIMKVKVKSLSRVQLFVTPWTVAYQAPLSMGFSRQEYWSVLPFPSPGDLPDPGIKPRFPALEADALTSEPPGKPILII